MIRIVSVRYQEREDTATRSGAAVLKEDGSISTIISEQGDVVSDVYDMKYVFTTFNYPLLW